MIHPNLLPSSAHPPLSEAQKQQWKIAIRNQPSIGAGYRRTPMENYNILKINQLEVFFNFTKEYYEVVFFGLIIFLGLEWRFDNIGIMGCIAGAWLFGLICQHRFGDNTIWNIAVSDKGLTLRNEYNGYLQIAFQQIICIDYKKYYNTDGTRSGELVVYYAYHNDRYLIQRTLIVGNEVNTMSIIHYFFNKYQNQLP